MFLSVEDFLGMELFKPNLNTMEDYIVAVAEVARLKYMYEEDDNIVDEQDRELRIKKQENITQNIQSVLASFPVTNILDHQENPSVVNNLDHQEKPDVTDFIVPRGQRSLRVIRRRKVTEKFVSNEELIKKAVEHNVEVQENSTKVVVGNTLIKIKWDAKYAVANPKRKLSHEALGIGCSNQQLFDVNKVVKRSSPKRERDNEGESSRKKKKVKRNIVRDKAPENKPELPRELPMEFKKAIIDMGGSVESAVLVIQKSLFLTDVITGEGRLSIPLKQVENEFLKPEEVQHVNTRNSKGKMCEMRVKLIEPSLCVSEINLRKWSMDKANGRTSYSYVLVTTWNDVARRNSMEVGHWVQLWAFRKGSDLCLALVRYILDS